MDNIELAVFTQTLNDIKSKLPFKVAAVNRSRDDFSDVDEWIAENIKGDWRAFTFLIYFFENENDAILFKLRFG